MGLWDGVPGIRALRAYQRLAWQSLGGRARSVPIDSLSNAADSGCMPGMRSFGLTAPGRQIDFVPGPRMSYPTSMQPWRYLIGMSIEVMISLLCSTEFGSFS